MELNQIWGLKVLQHQCIFYLLLTAVSSPSFTSSFQRFDRPSRVKTFTELGKVEISDLSYLLVFVLVKLI